MPSLKIAKASNAAFSPNYLPVALFFGGTRGIGAGMAQAFARATNGNSHIIILARSRQTADALIATFPKPTALGAKHEFIECDGTLMKNVQRATDEILSRVDRINFIAMTLAVMDKVGSDFTEEGLEKKLTTTFYARLKFVFNLLPALEKAAADGQDATVYHVLGGGKLGGHVDLNNLGFKKPTSFMNMRAQIPSYGNLVMERLAAEHPNISWLNAYPGFVDTGIWNGVQDSVVAKIIAVILNVIGPWIGYTSADSGEYMTYGMLSTSRKPGIQYLGEKGDITPPSFSPYTDEEREKVWEHFVSSVVSKS
ncbi:NAD(P)-binding protein [Flagelloscypha sp. PMI_526]|nr:NAD(P)-binding protein [Flagelloscypha sp. PMI_526]